MSGLILPPNIGPTGQDEVFGRCLVCGETFYRGGEAAWQRHVGRCARAHIDEIREEAARQRLENRMPVFDEENWNKDWSDHMRKVGERMLRDGDFTMKRREKSSDES